MLCKTVKKQNDHACPLVPLPSASMIRAQVHSLIFMGWYAVSLLRKHILLLFLNDSPLILRKHALNREGESIHDVLAEVGLDIRLVKPIMAHESPLTLRHFHAGKPVRLRTRKFPDVFVVIVADMFAKSRLLVEFGFFPVRAARVACIVWAFVPCFQDFHGFGIVLDHHKACIRICAIEAVGVIIGFVSGPRVQSHGDAMRRFDFPVIQHPFYGEVYKAKRSVCVKENDEFVVFNVLGKRRGLDPGRVAVFEFVRADEFVVVAVDLGVGVMAEDAAGDVVQFGPVEFAVSVLFCGLEGPRFEIEDEDVFGQVFGVARLCRQAERGLVLGVFVVKGKCSIGGGDLHGRKEEAEYIVDGGGGSLARVGSALVG
jgi:hypothetical protein